MLSIIPSLVLIVSTCAIAPDSTFETERQAHETHLLISEHFPSEPLPEIKHPSLEYTSYQGPLGEYGAIATHVTETETKRPAVIWVTGGFGGIFSDFDLYTDLWNDQSVASFLDREIVVYLPTFRGEHQNPGVFECFYGEVNDLVAAIEHVAQRPDVDPERIFVMGHSTGGTNALLSAFLTEIPAGVVSFGGAPDMHSIAADGKGYGKEPYELADAKEVRLRSPIEFTKDLRVPVLYVEGSESFYVEDAYRMQRIANEAGTDFRAAIVSGEDHFSVLRPGKDYLANHIESGNTTLPSAQEMQNAIQSYYAHPNTLLLLNIEEADSGVIKELIDQGGDANLTNDFGVPLLVIASSSNPDPEVIDVLIRAGAKLGWRSSIGGSALIYASIWNPTSITPLIKAGVEVDARDNQNANALMYAVAETKDTNIILSLIQSGSDIKATDIDGYTVLHYAAANGADPAVIKLLIDQGAPVNTTTTSGSTPLMLACEFTTNPLILTTLLDHGATIEQKDQDGRTAYQYAAENDTFTDEPLLERLKPQQD